VTALDDRLAPTSTWSGSRGTGSARARWPGPRVRWVGSPAPALAPGGQVPGG